MMKKKLRMRTIINLQLNGCDSLTRICILFSNWALSKLLGGNIRLERKKVTVIFITGILVGMFIILPILYYFGIPSFDHFLIRVFGDNNPLALVFSILLILLIVIGIYKKT